MSKTLFSEYQPHHQVGTSVRDYLRQLAEYWDHKLDNNYNEWPLAPRDLTALGLVDQRNYNIQSFHLGAPSRAHMEQELEIIGLGRNGNGSEWWADTLGPGLWKRDMYWIRRANQLGWNTSSYDLSSVSCRLGQKFLSSKIPKPPDNITNLVTQDFAEHVTAEDGQMDPATDRAIYTAEFWQILAQDLMETNMYNIGRKYRRRPRNLCMIVVHPFPEDNDKATEWNGITLPGVEWGDTTPYSLEQLLAPLEAGLNRHIDRSLQTMRLEKTVYYHQTYSIFTLRVKK